MYPVETVYQEYKYIITAVAVGHVTQPCGLCFGHPCYTC